MKCRHCSAPLNLLLVDLGTAPPANAYLYEKDLIKPEIFFPLRVLVCETCWLVQTEDHVQAAEIFSRDYSYFSSFSKTVVEQAKVFVEKAIDRFALGGKSRVIEIGSNDGYLLQFVHERRIPCLGIEPTPATALAAKNKGIDVVEDFFSSKLAARLIAAGHQADLIVANNILTQVPDINDFVAGIAALLSPTGAATFEFSHVLNLVSKTQFDSIYHENFSYLSLHAVDKIFEANGLSIFEVDELPTQGGSLRVYAQKKESKHHPLSQRVNMMYHKEQRAGMLGKGFYSNFQARVEEIKTSLLEFLLSAKKNKKTVAAYGAASKGSTLLNFAGIKAGFISYVVDQNPSKQGKFLPGSRLEIVSEDRLKTEKPDYILILPWNLQKEILENSEYVKEWGGQFVTAVPKMNFL